MGHGAGTDRFDAAQIAYMGKIRTQARRSAGLIPGLEVDDLVNEMLEVLYSCTLSYDPHKGATFNTLFWRSAHNRLSSLLRYSNAQKRNAEWVFLSDEDVARAAEIASTDDSAEDWAMAIEEVRIRRRAAAVA